MLIKMNPLTIVVPVTMTNIFKIDFDELWNQLEEEQSVKEEQSVTDPNLSLSKTDIGNKKGRIITNSSQDRQENNSGIIMNTSEMMGMKLEGSRQRRRPKLEFSESSFSAEFLLKTEEQKPCTPVAVSTNAYSSSGSGFFIPGITGTARCLEGSSSSSKYFIPGITGTARCLDGSTSNSSVDIPSTPQRQWQRVGSSSSVETTPITPRRRVRLLSKVVLADQEHILGSVKSHSSAREQRCINVERPADLWETYSSEHSQRLTTSPVAQQDVALLRAQCLERENKVKELYVNLEQRMRDLERREKKLKKKEARLRRELRN